MDMDLKAGFNFGGHALTFERNKTYHDHLHAIQKAVWPAVFAEVTKDQPFMTMESDFDEMHRLITTLPLTNPYLQSLGAATTETLVALGYDRERLAGAINKWMQDMTEAALEGLHYPSIYGAQRYKSRDSGLLKP